MKKKIVVGFSKACFTAEEINKLTNRQKLEHYLELSDGTCSYDCLDDFFKDLNEDIIGQGMVNGYLWCVVETD